MYIYICLKKNITGKNKAKISKKCPVCSVVYLLEGIIIWDSCPRNSTRQKHRPSYSAFRKRMSATNIFHLKRTYFIYSFIYYSV